MKYLRALIGFLIIFHSLTTALFAADEPDDFTIVAGVNYGHQTEKFEIFSGKIEPEFTMLGFSFATAYKDVYASIDYSESIKDYVQADYNELEEPSVVNYFSREDYSATLGYKAWRELTFFGGYKYGDTAVLQFSDTDSVTSTIKKFHLNDSGPFLGMSYTFGFQDKGSLNLSVAYADMVGVIKSTEYTESGFSKNSTEGSTSGFSYGLAWSGPLTGSLTYRVGLKVNEYRFEDEDLGLGPDLSSDAKFRIFTLSVANYF